MINDNSTKESGKYVTENHLFAFHWLEHLDCFSWWKWPYLQQTFMLFPSAQITIQKDFKLKRHLCVRDATSELYGVSSRGRMSLENLLSTAATSCRSERPQWWAMCFICRVEECDVKGRGLCGYTSLQSRGWVRGNWKSINDIGSPAKNDNISKWTMSIEGTIGVR